MPWECGPGLGTSIAVGVNGVEHFMALVVINREALHLDSLHKVCLGDLSKKSGVRAGGGGGGLHGRSYHAILVNV